MHKLYDRQGRHVAFLNLDKRATIHLNNGKLIAEIDHDCVFTTDGRHVGWLVRKQVYDREGALILAQQTRTDASDQPPSSESWNKGPSHNPAQRETAGQLPPIRDKWAKHSGLSFFEQALNIASSIPAMASPS